MGLYKLRIQYFGLEELLHHFQPQDLVPATRKNDDALTEPCSNENVQDFVEIPVSSNKRSLAIVNLVFRKLLDKISWECASHRKLNHDLIRLTVIDTCICKMDLLNCEYCDVYFYAIFLKFNMNE